MPQKKYIFQRILYYIYGEKFYKRLNYQWSDYPSRFELIQHIIDKKKYNNYLEIGCDDDENFSKINVKKKIGIDPASGGTHRMTSDEFFLSNKEKFDCIFIDGLHYYKQVKKDIFNSLKILNQNGVIFLHDCLPNNVYEQAIPRCQYNWNGDVWKAIVENRTLENLDTYTCYADHGVGIILKRKNRKKLKLNIDNNFIKLKFCDYYNNYKEYMNITEYEELKNLF